MSYCKEEGKDKIIFVTKEDQEKPGSEQLDEYYDGEPGLILDNGEINWNCPCLGGMATGPCGYEFRQAFTCFHESTENPKGSDCYEAFKSMQDCMTKFPTVYDQSEGDKDDDDEVDVFNTAGNEGEKKEESKTSGNENKEESKASSNKDSSGDRQSNKETSNATNSGDSQSASSKKSR